MCYLQALKLQEIPELHDLKILQFWNIFVSK